MARPNYEYARRQKELARKSRKEAKRQRRLARMDTRTPAGESGASVDSEPHEGTDRVGNH